MGATVHTKGRGGSLEWGCVEVMWQVSQACMLMEPTLVIPERHGPWAKGCV